MLLFSTHVDRLTKSPDWASAWILYESHLLQKIAERNVDYILVEPTFNFLKNYFRASDGFVMVSSIHQGRFLVFGVAKEVCPIDHRVAVTRRTSRCLGRLREEESPSFDFLVNFLTERVGLEESEVNGFVSGVLSARFRSVVFRKSW